jgi:hypothetical protein
MLIAISKFFIQVSVVGYNRKNDFDTNATKYFQACNALKLKMLQGACMLNFLKVDER